MAERPKLVTWVEEDYKSASEVPERLQNYLRILHKEGKSAQMLALATNLSEDFVAAIVREDPRETKPH